MVVEAAASQSAAVTDPSPKCWRCEKPLAVFVTRPWKLICQRCHAKNASPEVAACHRTNYDGKLLPANG